MCLTGSTSPGFARFIWHLISAYTTQMGRGRKGSLNPFLQQREILAVFLNLDGEQISLNLFHI